MTKNISEIISTIGYTQSYICRQFKKYMGITLVKYIQQIKCHYSLSLLTDSNILEKDIAYKLNFSDESAYINIFKKIYKITPGQWRKSLKHSKESLNI
jgi:AraC-like DNA-binding protein